MVYAEGTVPGLVEAVVWVVVRGVDVDGMSERLQA